VGQLKRVRIAVYGEYLWRKGTNRAKRNGVVVRERECPTPYATVQGHEQELTLPQKAPSHKPLMHSVGLSQGYESYLGCNVEEMWTTKGGNGENDDQFAARIIIGDLQNFLHQKRS
jgi:hypothetical protein